jgi:hypothetical protein
MLAEIGERMVPVRRDPPLAATGETVPKAAVAFFPAIRRAEVVEIEEETSARDEPVDDAVELLLRKGREVVKHARRDDDVCRIKAEGLEPTYVARRVRNAVLERSEPFARDCLHRS